MAETLSGLPIERAFVVHGAEGWDEPTPLGPFTVLDVRPGEVKAEIRSPSDYGLDLCGAHELAGGDSATNARALRAVLTGEQHGPHRDALLLGTALALEIVGRVDRAARWRAPRERGHRQWRRAPHAGQARGLRCGCRTMSGDFLSEMAASSRARSAAAQAQLSARELRARIADLPATPVLKLGAFDLIAEVKLRSPAGGSCSNRRTTEKSAHALAPMRMQEPPPSPFSRSPVRFDGSLADLAAGASALAPLNVPAMRKDFLVDAYQVLEGRLAGAGGVLAIIRMLPEQELEQLIDAALDLQMFVLLEAFDTMDIELAHTLVDSRSGHHHQLLVGVNSRDLATLKVVPGRLDALAPQLPTTVRRVAGKRCRDCRRRRAHGRLRLRPRAGGQRTHVRIRSGATRRAPCSCKAVPRCRSSTKRRPRMTSAPRPFIKICGMTTPVAVSTAMACEVDAIGFVFATSVRQVTTQRAAELAAPARGKIACVAVTRHPTRELILEILRDFRPDILQTDIDDIAGLHLPATLSVLPVMRPGPQAGLRAAGASAVRRDR
jgi:indole-3-glycerol phosphate synthase